MNIAQIAPLAESCPPQLYGGTERTVSYLTEELVRQGHEVTLFASGDSKTRAHLVAGVPQALRLGPRSEFSDTFALLMQSLAVSQADQFDVLHFHCGHTHLPLAHTLGPRAITTLHGALEHPELLAFHTAFAQAPLVSISMAQRLHLQRGVQWVANIAHGLPHDLLPFTARPAGNYLAFLGRISREKRPDRAIEIALACGLPLRIAAKVDPTDEDYWVRHIQPLIQANPSIEFIGEIDEHQKAGFLGNACALLFPIDWPEPFGLAMIEAMACGTPVIAFNHGSVPEVIDAGLSGFIVDSVEQAVSAVGKLDSLQRRQVRAVFEQRFTVERMADRYLALYRQQIKLAGRSRVFLPAACDSEQQVLGTRTLKHNDTFGVFDAQD